MGLWPFGAKKAQAPSPLVEEPVAEAVAVEIPAPDIVVELADPVVEEEPSQPAITHDDFHAGMMTRYAFTGIIAKFYAIMNGFYVGDELERLDELVLDRWDEFRDATVAEPDFSDERCATAVQALLVDMDQFAKLVAWAPDRMLSKRSAKDREVLKGFLSIVKEVGAAELFKQLQIDPGEWLVANVLELRGYDLQVIGETLEGKKLYLRPLLLRSRMPNKYGDVDWKGFFSELAEFGNQYFGNAEDLHFFPGFPLRKAGEMVADWFDQPTTEVLEMPTNGVDFEHWCAAQIEQQGWAVRVSKASGDQGVDLEAMRPGFTVAVQCKRYTSPIGNKAVQEAFAGVTHYKADVACVIGTGGFTPSAQQLALSTGVILIDASSIADFTSLVDRQ